MSIAELGAAFPPEAISWRAQSVSKKTPDNPKAMALAYIDARDVMARLDAAVGPANWSDSYVETPLGRVICTLSIRVDGEWISKSDGAGKTDIEGDKGGLSDALKRAAVKWGIGRYLYDMPSPWVPCKLYNDKWSEWTPDGLKELARIAAGNSPRSTPTPKPNGEPALTDEDQDCAEIATLAQAAGVQLGVILESYNAKNLQALTAEQRAKVKKRLNLTIDEKLVATEGRKAA